MILLWVCSPAVPRVLGASVGTNVLELRHASRSAHACVHAAPCPGLDRAMRGGSEGRLCVVRGQGWLCSHRDPVQTSRF